ncbi:MAG: four helix bundle protein [Vicinamibacteria bacterium]|nr:four helix bundle protein [Vicinamibacteria bacterium]
MCGAAPVGPERLLAYTVGREFRRVAMMLEVRGGGLRDQLDRASASVLLNCAEAVGRSGRRDQARLFAIARGSAYECLAILDLLEGDQGQSEVLGQAGGLLRRCIALLAGLVLRNGG